VQTLEEKYDSTPELSDLNSELQDIMDLICVFPLECAQPAGFFFFFCMELKIKQVIKASRNVPTILGEQRARDCSWLRLLKLCCHAVPALTLCSSQLQSAH